MDPIIEQHQDVHSYPDTMKRSVDTDSSNSSSCVSDNEIEEHMDTVQDHGNDTAGSPQNRNDLIDPDDANQNCIDGQQPDEDVFSMVDSSENSNLASNYCGSSNTGSNSGKFEEPGDDNVDSGTGEIRSDAQPETECLANKHMDKMEEDGSPFHDSDTTGSVNVTAPIASLSEVDLSDSDDNELEPCLRGRSSSHDLPIDAKFSAELMPSSEAFRLAHQSHADIPLKFEQARSQNEVSSPSYCPSSSEPIDQKEEALNHEEKKHKEQLNDLDDLDLPSEERSPGLNLDASKQKVQLRQRGSLAKRRKPTRPSIRTSSQSDDLFAYTTNIPVENGYDISMESSSQSESSTPDTDRGLSTTNVDMSTTSQQELIRPDKNIHGIKTAIVHSEIAATGRQRLRNVPMPVSIEKRPSPTVNGDKPPVTPPWMLETKLRRSVRPLKEETEKQKLNSEPQTPPWLKEALTKKRRAASRISQSSIDSDDTHLAADSGQTTSVPWLHEAALRRTRQLEPLTVTQKDFSNNVNNIIADSSRDEVFIDDVQQDVHKNDKVISSSGKELVTNSKSRLQEQENLPPASSSVNRSSSETDAYLRKYEKLPSIKHNRMQPEQKHTSPGQEKAEEPAWKAEIVMRRKSKSYVVAQKPEQPLKLGEMPQWKKDLLEKNKQRRVSTEGADSVDTISIDKKLETSTQNGDVPPWKVELAQRRGSRLSSIGAAPEALETLIEKKKSQTKPPEEEPEWAQLVARRRQRLASSGLLPAEECAKTE